MRLTARILPVVAALLALGGCGGGGGGGGGGSRDGNPPPASPPSAAVLATGWIGWEEDGWRTSTPPSSLPSGRSGLRDFDGPGGVAVDGAGSVYVADQRNHRIVKWDRDGHAVGWIGGGRDGWQTGDAPPEGHDFRSFWMPNTVFVDADGAIYVSDTNMRVSKWDRDGNAVGWIGGGEDGWHTADGPGIGGSDFRSLRSPKALWVDADGNVYVADYSHHRISKWDRNGNAVGWIGGGTDGWQTGDAPNEGASDYRSFFYPYGLAVATDGTIYVADLALDRLAKWRADGTSVGWVGRGFEDWQTIDGNLFSEGSGDRWFSHPSDIAFGLDGSLYVADPFNYRVMRWSPDGKSLGWIGDGWPGWHTGDGAAKGDGPASFRAPTAVTVDEGGDLFIADGGNQRVTRFSADGTPTGWIGGGKDGWEQDDAPVLGPSLGRFVNPTGVAFDSAGRVYVADAGAHRVARWDADGNPLGWVGEGQAGWQTGPSLGVQTDRIGSGFLGSPQAVVLDASGNLYVSEAANHRISKLTADGIPLGWIGGGVDGWQTGSATGPGDDPRRFDSPAGLLLADGVLYVADAGNDRISRWSLEGEALGWIGGGFEGWQLGTGTARGSTRRHFRYPRDVAVDGAGVLYVTDAGNHRVARWSSSGDPLGWIGGGTDGWKSRDTRIEDPDDEVPGDSGRTLRHFQTPTGVLVASDGDLYVTDGQLDRVSVWSADGTARGWFGGGLDGWRGHLDAVSGGSDFRQFDFPEGLALTADGLLFVADSLNDRISRWRIR